LKTTVTSCRTILNFIKTFIIPTDAHYYKNHRMLKQFKIITLAPTFFGSRTNHHQGAVLFLAKTTEYGVSVLVGVDAVNFMAAYQPVVQACSSQRIPASTVNCLRNSRRMLCRTFWLYSSFKISFVHLRFFLFYGILCITYDLPPVILYFFTYVRHLQFLYYLFFLLCQLCSVELIILKFLSTYYFCPMFCEPDFSAI
jgi:hypothetical protein